MNLEKLKSLRKVCCRGCLFRGVYILIYNLMTFWETVLATVIAWVIISLITWIWVYRREIFLFFKRYKLKYLPVTFNFAFSIEFQEWLNTWKYFNELIKNFKKIISDESLSDVIKINNFSDIYLFNNKEEAEIFKKKKDLDLIIWWDFSNDVLKEKWKWKLSKLDLKYTYWILNDDKWNIWRLVQNDLSTKFAEKNYWTIYDENSYNDIKIVWNNLWDMALYILSVSLKFQWNLLKSTEILEKHLNNLLKRNDNFIRHIKFHLFNNYELFIKDILFNTNKYNKEKRYFLWKEYCNKILNLFPDNFFALTNLAYFEYNTWNKYKAKQLIEIIKDKYSKSPCYMVNIWFFYLLDNKYKEAYKWYNQIYNIKRELIDFEPIDVISFLSLEYEKIKNPWLLFASWLLSHLYWDKSIAKKDLSNFIKITDKEKAKLMYSKAEKILQYL